MTLAYLLILAAMVGGLCLTAAALAHAARNLSAMRRARVNGARLIAARHGVRSEAIILIVHCVLLAAVAWSAGIPAGEGFVRVLLVRNYFSALASALLTVATVAEWLDRRKLFRLYRLQAPL